MSVLLPGAIDTREGAERRGKNVHFGVVFFFGVYNCYSTLSDARVFSFILKACCIPFRDELDAYDHPSRMSPLCLDSLCAYALVFLKVCFCWRVAASVECVGLVFFVPSLSLFFFAGIESLRALVWTLFSLWRFRCLLFPWDSCFVDQHLPPHILSTSLPPRARSVPVFCCRLFFIFCVARFDIFFFVVWRSVG